MRDQKRPAKKFKNLRYREVQRVNSENRRRLKLDDQKWLKENGYKNFGWDNVIRLYQKIEEFLEQYPIEELTLEELFLEADHIGNKYLTPLETEEFNQKLAQTANEISELIDQQFPDTEIEVLDFSSPTRSSPKKSSQKTYRTTQPT